MRPRWQLEGCPHDSEQAAVPHRLGNALGRTISRPRLVWHERRSSAPPKH